MNHKLEYTISWVPGKNSNVEKPYDCAIQNCTPAANGSTKCCQNCPCTNSTSTIKIIRPQPANYVTVPTVLLAGVLLSLAAQQAPPPASAKHAPSLPILVQPVLQALLVMLIHVGPGRFRQPQEFIKGPVVQYVIGGPPYCLFLGPTGPDLGQVLVSSVQGQVRPEPVQPSNADRRGTSQSSCAMHVHPAGAQQARQVSAVGGGSAAPTQQQALPAERHAWHLGRQQDGCNAYCRIIAIFWISGQ